MPEQKEPFHVLIIASADWISAARLVPVLKQAGCWVTAIAPEGAGLLKRGVVDEVVVAGNSIEQTVEKALELVGDRHEPFDYIQIADDHLLWYLTDHRDDQRLRPIQPFEPDGDIADVLTCKHTFTEQLAGTALKVVPGYGAANSAEALDAADRLGYPVILKPSRGSGGVDVQRYESRQELECALEDVPIEQPFVVQQFIAGRVGLVEFLMDHGEPLCWTVWYKTKTIGGPFGGSSARELFTVPGMREQLRLFGQATRFHGFCGLDLIHEEGTGEYYFIEVNPRQTSGHLFGWSAGADFAKAFAAMLEGRREVHAPVEQRLDGLRIRAFPADVERSIYTSDARSLITAPLDPALWRDIRSQHGPLLLHCCRVIWAEVQRKVRNILKRFRRA